MYMYHYWISLFKMCKPWPVYRISEVERSGRVSLNSILIGLRCTSRSYTISHFVPLYSY